MGLSTGITSIFILLSVLCGLVLFVPLALAWTDDPLVPNVTPIRLVHINELRTAINIKRQERGLSLVQWTDSSLTVNESKIGAVHIQEMRTALEQLYAAAGKPLPTFTDDPLIPNTTQIRAVHITELRRAIDDPCPSGEVMTGFNADGTPICSKVCTPGEIEYNGECYRGFVYFNWTGTCTQWCANLGGVAHDITVWGDRGDPCLNAIDGLGVHKQMGGGNGWLKFLGSKGVVAPPNVHTNYSECSTLPNDMLGIPNAAWATGCACRGGTRGPSAMPYWQRIPGPSTINRSANPRCYPTWAGSQIYPGWGPVGWANPCGPVVGQKCWTNVWDAICDY